MDNNWFNYPLQLANKTFDWRWEYDILYHSISRRRQCLARGPSIFSHHACDRMRACVRRKSDNWGGFINTVSVCAYECCCQVPKLTTCLHKRNNLTDMFESRCAAVLDLIDCHVIRNIQIDVVIGGSSTRQCSFVCIKPAFASYINSIYSTKYNRCRMCFISYTRGAPWANGFLVVVINIQQTRAAYIVKQNSKLNMIVYRYIYVRNVLTA